MAAGTTTFPATAIDSNAVADDTTEISSGGFNDHSVQIEAIETKIGVNSSAVNTSLDYFLKHASGAYRTHTHDASSDDGAKIPEANVVFGATGHDHTGTTSGNLIPTAGIEDEAVTTAKIKDANVTAAKIAAEAYTAWTPSLYKSDGTTALTGTIDIARYSQIGKHVRAYLTVTAMGNPSGALIYFTLPVACRNNTATYAVDVGTGYTSNGTTGLIGRCIIPINQTTKGIFYYGIGTSNWGASGNSVSMSFKYEAA